MAPPDRKLWKIEVICWVIIVILSGWSFRLMNNEWAKIGGGQRVRMPAVSKQEDLTKGRNLLLKLLDTQYSLGQQSLRLIPRVGTREELEITTDDAKATKIISDATRFDYALRELRVEKLVCKSTSGKTLGTYVTTPNFLGIGVAPDLILLDLIGGTKTRTTSNTNLIENILLLEVERHVSRYLSADPQDPLLIMDRALVNRIRGKDMDQQRRALEKVIAINKIDPQAKQRVALATNLLALLTILSDKQIAPHSANSSEATSIELKTSETARVNELITFIRDNTPKDYFQTYLIAATYDHFGENAKSEAVIAEFSKDRNTSYRMFAILASSALASLLLLLVSYRRKENIWLLPGKGDLIACPVAYGWFKPLLIVFLSASISTLMLVFVFLQCPPLLITGGSTLIAAFDPNRVALLDVADQLAVTLPVIVLTYLFVGMRLPFLEFIRLRLQSYEYTLKNMLSFGRIGFGICWAIANVCMFLSLWFHYPGDKPSTIGIGLIATSAQPTAIALWFFGSAILAPLTEEIIFRGILHSALRRHCGFIPAALLGSLIFALVHQEFTPWWLIHKFLMGYINVYLLEKTGSIVPGIINHVLINTFVVIFLCLCS
jgi:membrane protease YdiL (CAAX protease family)